jgi:hypothetical protein
LQQAGEQAASALAPWEAAGVPALDQYSSQLGLGGEGVDLPPGIMSPDQIRDNFETSPGYEFRRSEALRGIEQSQAVKGVAMSGQTYGALAEYSSGLASQEYGNYYNREMGLYNQYMGRLAGLSDMGYNAAVAGANVRIGVAGQAAQSNTQAAQAIAQGQQQSSAAWGGALAGVGQAAGTALGYYGNRPGTPTTTGFTAPPTAPSSGYLAGTDLTLAGGW